MSKMCVICLFIVTSVQSQSVLNCNSFFSTRLDQKEQDYVSLEQVKFPWIEDVDIRTETRDLDFAKQEYTLRISPSTPRIRKAQENLLETYKAEPNDELADINRDQIFNAYRDWVKVFLINEEVDIYRELSNILSDRRIISEKNMIVSGFDPDEIVKNEVALAAVTQKLYELQLAEVGLVGDEVTVDHSDIVSVFKMLDIIASADIQSDRTGIMFDRQVLQDELALENAEKKKYLDFIQFKYSGPHDDLLRERIALGVGFRLSNASSRKMKMERLGVELRQLDQEFSLGNEVKAHELLEVKQDLNFNIKLLNNFDELQKGLFRRIDIVSEGVKKQVGFDPLIILEINETKLQLKLDRLDIIEDIYLNYLKFLSLSELMYQLPFKNFLAA